MGIYLDDAASVILLSVACCWSYTTACFSLLTSSCFFLLLLASCFFSLFSLFSFFSFFSFASPFSTGDGCAALLLQNWTISARSTGSVYYTVISSVLEDAVGPDSQRHDQPKCWSVGRFRLVPH